MKGEEDIAQGPQLNRQGVPDVIWTHPTNNSKVYAGDINVANKLETLEFYKIHHIVNA